MQDYRIALLTQSVFIYSKLTVETLEQGVKCLVTFMIKTSFNVVFVITKSLRIWDKVFKNGPSEICGRHPLNSLQVFLKSVFHKFHLVHS